MVFLMLAVNLLDCALPFYLFCSTSFYMILSVILVFLTFSVNFQVFNSFSSICCVCFEAEISSFWGSRTFGVAFVLFIFDIYIFINVRTKRSVSSNVNVNMILCFSWFCSGTFGAWCKLVDIWRARLVCFTTKITIFGCWRLWCLCCISIFLENMITLLLNVLFFCSKHWV